MAGKKRQRHTVAVEGRRAAIDEEEQFPVMGEDEMPLLEHRAVALVAPTRKLPRRISSRGLKAINFYLQGVPAPQAAKLAGMTGGSLGRLLKSQFGAAYVVQYYAAVSERIKGLHSSAIEVVAEALRYPDMNIRLRAAEGIIKNVAATAPKGTDSGKLSATDVAQAIMAKNDINVNVGEKDASRNQTTIDIQRDSDGDRSLTGNDG